jgi:hypothetical protein
VANFRQVNIFDQLGVALGLASLAGVNLYLTALVTGLAVRFGWVDLAGSHESLAVLGNGWVLGIAGALFLVEFIADKVPWVDSSWDAVHTLIRPLGGVLLAIGALGDVNPALVAIGGLVGGGAALTTHAAKAGTRVLVNMSPEPFSNSVASVAEDGLVLGGLGLIAGAPVVAFFVFVAVMVVAVIVVRKTWGGVRRAWHGVRRKRPDSAV